MSRNYRIFQIQNVILVITVYLLSISVPSHAKPVRLVQGNNGIETYAKGLLTLALSKLPEKYELKETAPNSSEERMVSMLIDGELDIVWYATTNDLEERLQPIRICIYR